MFKIFLTFLLSLVQGNIYDHIKSSVQKVSKINYDKTVINTRSSTKNVQIIHYYKPTDYGSKEFVEQFEKFADEYQGIFKIQACNCALESFVCEKEQIKQFPTFRIYPPQPIPSIDFEGQPDVKKILNLAAGYLQSNVIELSSTNIDTFLKEAPSVPKVLLFTEKPTGVPTIFKGLSINFEQKLFFGIVRAQDEMLIDRYKVKTYPQILIIKSNEKQPIPYKGEMKYKQIFEFLNIYSEAFVAGGGSSADSAATKIWLTEMVPQFTKQSGNDICLKADGVLCSIVFSNGKPDQTLLQILKDISMQFAPKIQRGSIFKFMWIDAQVEKNWVEGLQIEEIPSLLVLNPGTRKRYVMLEDQITIENKVYLRGLSMVIQDFRTLNSFLNLFDCQIIYIIFLLLMNQEQELKNDRNSSGQIKSTLQDQKFERKDNITNTQILNLQKYFNPKKQRFSLFKSDEQSKSKKNIAHLVQEQFQKKQVPIFINKTQKTEYFHIRTSQQQTRKLIRQKKIQIKENKSADQNFFNFLDDKNEQNQQNDLIIESKNLSNSQLLKKIQELQKKFRLYEFQSEQKDLQIIQLKTQIYQLQNERDYELEKKDNQNIYRTLELQQKKIQKYKITIKNQTRLIKLYNQYMMDFDGFRKMMQETERKGIFAQKFENQLEKEQRKSQFSKLTNLQAQYGTVQLFQKWCSDDGIDLMTQIDLLRYVFEQINKNDNKEAQFQNVFLLKENQIVYTNILTDFINIYRTELIVPTIYESLNPEKQRTFLYYLKNFNQVQNEIHKTIKQLNICQMDKKLPNHFPINKKMSFITDYVTKDHLKSYIDEHKDTNKLEQHCELLSSSLIELTNKLQITAYFFQEDRISSNDITEIIHLLNKSLQVIYYFNKNSPNAYKDQKQLQRQFLLKEFTNVLDTINYFQKFNGINYQKDSSFIALVEFIQEQTIQCQQKYQRILTIMNMKDEIINYQKTQYDLFKKIFMDLIITHKQIRSIQEKIKKEIHTKIQSKLVNKGIMIKSQNIENMKINELKNIIKYVHENLNSIMEIKDDDIIQYKNEKYEVEIETYELYLKQANEKIRQNFRELN